ncbi:hypothetical protein OTU49_017519, partial [Cherax quadricarinatus]
MVPIVDAILAELYAGQSDEEETGTEIADLSIHLPHQSQMDLVPAEDTQNSHRKSGSVHVDSEFKNGKVQHETVKKVDKMVEEGVSTGLTTIPPNKSCQALR